MSETQGRLVPTLGLTSIVVFGLSYMAPVIVVSTFGVIATTSHGAAPTAYLVATLAMTLTGLSYAKMSRTYPASGSVYTYARKLLGSRIGFLAGWTILLDYFFLPMAAWLIESLYLNVQFSVLPVWGWLIVVIAASTLVNILGIVIADKVNKVLLGLTTLGLLAIVTVCLHHIAATPPEHAAHALWNPATSIGAITAAAAIAAYSFLGFDAVSTLSEEVRDAKRNVPRGIVLTVIIGGTIFIFISLLMQWVHPGATFTDESTAGYEVTTLAGGEHFANITNAIGLLGGFASCVAIQASTSRLMFVMGRDNVLPRRIFGYLHPRFRTPVFNLLLIGAVGLLAVKLSLAVATSFINFGAFLAFTLVNICVITAWNRHRHNRSERSKLTWIVLPAAGAAIDLYLITKLSHTAILLGITWLILGVIYLAIITRGLRQPPPEYNPDPAAELMPSARTDTST